MSDHDKPGEAPEVTVVKKHDMPVLDAIITTDRDLRIRHWNRGAERLFGQTADQAHDRQLDLLVCEKNLRSDLRRFLEGGQQQAFEIPLKRIDGAALRVNVSCTVAGAENPGADAVLILTMHEVTARKGIQAKAARDETFYRTLFDLSPDAVVTIQEYRYIDCNRAALQLFGLASAEELRSAKPGQFSPALQPDGRESAAAARQYFDDCRQQGSVSFDWTYRTSAGREFQSRVFLKSMNIDGRILLQAVIRDVSDLQALVAKSRAQVDFLEAVLDGSPVVIFVFHLESGAIRFANCKARSVLQLGNEPAITVPVQDLWADSGEHQRLLESFRRDGACREEVRLRQLDDGEVLHTEVSWQYKPGDTDEVICWSMDQSAQKKIAQQLHDQERMWRQIVDYLPVALYAKNPNDDFRYTLCNRKSEELFDGAFEPMIGRTDFEIFPADIALTYREEDLEVAANGRPLEIPEEVIESASGQLIYTRTIKISVPDAQGKNSLIVGMSENITERREAEQALYASEQRFRDLAENAPVGIILTNPRGACIYANAQWQNMTGLNQRQAAGHGWNKAIHPQDRMKVLREWRDFVAKGAPFRQEYRFKNRNGKIIWVSGAAVQFRNVAGQTVGLLGTATDITERKNFELELRASRDEAQNANRAKSDFLSRMSHEFRTPLNAVLGFGQLLEMSGENLSDDQKDSLTQILAGGAQLLELIDDVLDFTRIDTGDIRVDIQRTHSGDVLQRALSMTAPMAERAGVKITQPAAPCPDVLADPRRLLQVLSNLLGNAIKYNQPGGDVRVFHEARTNGFVRIAVQDSGRGILPEHYPLLFEPFERITDRDQATAGTGIGLSICKRVMDLLGGQIGFESEYGRGSTFWIELPAAGDPERTIRNKD
ncbi:MAG: PAS domain-containing sensor histidine kinase [Xanthomonadales bacterium]|nr:PAS domain-containing sensor histidine kinase [Xanthomonadales bacterium]